MADAPGTTQRQATLAAIAAEIGRGEITFPSSSQLALRIRQALDDPDTASSSVARLIQADPLLAARTVALANSALFSRSGKPVTDVAAAVSRLGFSVVRSLVTALVARQIAGAPAQQLHRNMAAQLWEHTSHVAALACVLARKVTKQDPDTAMFAGLMHEVGGFYLISRASDYPGLLDGHWLVEWSDDHEDEVEEGSDSGRSVGPTFESRIGHAILGALAVPPVVIEAAETVWSGFLTLPPESLGDTLLLADRLVPIRSPFDRSADSDVPKTAASIDMAVEDEMLQDILSEAAGEVNALAKILRG